MWKTRQSVNPLAQRPQQWSPLTLFSTGLKPPQRWKMYSKGNMTWNAPKVKHPMTTCSIDIVGGLCMEEIRLWILNPLGIRNTRIMTANNYIGELCFKSGCQHWSWCRQTSLVWWAKIPWRKKHDQNTKKNSPNSGGFGIGGIFAKRLTKQIWFQEISEQFIRVDRIQSHIGFCQVSIYKMESERLHLRNDGLTTCVNPNFRLDTSWTPLSWWSLGDEYQGYKLYI